MTWPSLVGISMWALALLAWWTWSIRAMWEGRIGADEWYVPIVMLIGVPLLAVIVVPLVTIAGIMLCAPLIEILSPGHFSTLPLPFLWR